MIGQNLPANDAALHASSQFAGDMHQSVSRIERALVPALEPCLARCREFLRVRDFLATPTRFVGVASSAVMNKYVFAHITFYQHAQIQNSKVP